MAVWSGSLPYSSRSSDRATALLLPELYLLPKRQRFWARSAPARFKPLSDRLPARTTIVPPPSTDPVKEEGRCHSTLSEK